MPLRLGFIFISAPILSLSWRGGTTRGEACGLIGVNAGNLTRGDSRMKARLTTLPDELRGGA